MPGTLDIEVFAGARFDLALEITDALTNAAVNLTGRTFYAHIRRTSEEALVLALTCTVDDAVQGKISLSAIPAATANLTIQNCNWDLIDNTGTLWLRGDCKISRKITQLP